MSLINVTTPEKNVRELEFSIERAVFDKACNAVYKKNVAKMTVPGFRKGKAPRSIIEKMYGTGVFYEEALNNLLPEAYEAVIKEADLKDIVSRPEFDVKSIDETAVVMLAKVYVKPEVVVKDYRGIEVERSVIAVTDSDIDAEIEKLRQRNSREIEVTDRAAQMGDTVVFDFDGSVDGVAFDGGKSENYNLKLGSGQFIPGFEEQIVGKSIDEEFDVNVTFPEEYHAEELAGKPAVFKCKLHAIKATELPEVDDEFIQDYTEFENIADYREDVRKNLEKAAEERADRAVDDQMFEALTNKLNADIPDAMIENRIDQNINEFSYRLQMQGISFDDYVKFTGGDMTAIRESMKDQATHQVKVRLALEKIVELEKIEITDEQLDAEYAKLAEQYGMEIDAVKNAIPAKDLRGDLAADAAVKVVRDSAKIKQSK